MKKSSAFTLIELLVVITIIAILAGIALPVFTRVQEKARVTQDLSNLRQLGIGTVAYLNDNNDTMFTSTTKANTFYAPGLLQVNYVPNVKVFLSPFDKRSGGTPNPISYGVNDNILNPNNASPVWDSNWTKLTAASQLILYTVAYAGDPKNSSSWTGVDTNFVSVPFGGAGMTPGTHQNGRWIDVLYADMHVASIKLTEFQTKDDKSATGGINGLKQWQPMVQ
jgi:prepilin-type N-terminal cleavage/methylation domain-containing protein